MQLSSNAKYRQPIQALACLLSGALVHLTSSVVCGKVPSGRHCLCHYIVVGASRVDRVSHHQQASVHVQLLSDINSGGLVVNSRSMGLYLGPAAEKVRSPPPPALASAPGSFPHRPGSGQERAPAQLAGRSGRLAGSGANLTGPSTEPQSPVHRGGVDISYLRLHDLHL